MNIKAQLKSYLTKDRNKGFFVGKSFLEVLLGFFILWDNDIGNYFLFVVGCLFACNGGYRLCWILCCYASTRCWIYRMEKRGQLQAVLIDFENSELYFDGALRLGKKWCFGMGSYIPTAYAEIERVYQDVHKRNSAEIIRNLQAVTENGQTKRICDIPVHARETQELNQVIDCISANHPGIKIG